MRYFLSNCIFCFGLWLMVFRWNGKWTLQNFINVQILTFLYVFIFSHLFVSKNIFSPLKHVFSGNTTLDQRSSANSKNSVRLNFAANFLLVHISTQHLECAARASMINDHDVVIIRPLATVLKLPLILMPLFLEEISQGRYLCRFIV